MTPAMEVDRPQHNDEVSIIRGRVGKMGINPALAESLADNIIAQILVDKLIDKIKGLQDELEQAKCTTTSLTFRLTSTVCKHPASPSPNSSDDKEH